MTARHFAFPNRYQRMIIMICVATIVSGCFFKKDEKKFDTAEEYYDKAHDYLEDGDYEAAITYYETLEARFPFSRQARQGQLDIIYAYFLNREPELVIDASRQFERENPTHPRVDYAIYMRGRALFSGQKNLFHRWFRVDLSRRPPKDARQSYSAFAELIRRFAESPYAPDSRQRMIFLRNRVAEHENHIARYYFERGAYAAAINRASYAVKVFDGAPTTVNSLQIMANSYRKLGMNDLAVDAEATLKLSFPESKFTELSVEEKPWWNLFW
jgi:outer membrane protein assembly factor BamD